VGAQERPLLLARGLRLEFRRTGDRWTHALSVAVGREPAVAPIAEAVEGDPAHPEPLRVVSPVFQDLRDHALPDGACFLLTGQSTPHHFSAAVTARCDGPRGVIAFDIADRCRAPIDVLAATYVVPLGSSALIDATPEQIVWGGAESGLGRLELAAGGGGQVTLAEAGRVATRVQAIARIDPTSYTHRLFYSWRWTPPG
jgi:hypothetical protein